MPTFMPEVSPPTMIRSCRLPTSGKAERWLDDFIKAAGIRIEPVTEDQAHTARSAHLQFGKGTGHGAALNYGDCFAYALAKKMDAVIVVQRQRLSIDRHRHRVAFARPAMTYSRRRVRRHTIPPR